MSPPVATPLRALEIRARSPGAAIALSQTLAARATRDGAAYACASVLEGPAVLLGAAQRAGRVVDLAACASSGVRVYRRATTGTAAYVGARAIFWSLALPSVDALVPDATSATALNRNVRGFLKGFTRAGGLAHYFGREWLAVSRRPCGLLGIDVREGGGVLIDVIAGFDASIALPDAIAAPEERATERWRGKLPAALAALLPASRGPEDVARIVLESLAGGGRATLEYGASEAPDGPLVEAPEVADPRDPLPSGTVLGPAVTVPIGAIEAAVTHGAGATPGRSAWVGGDALTSVRLLEAVASAFASGREDTLDLGGEVLEGARPADLLAALRAASLRGKIPAELG